MEINCVFAPTMDTPDHIATAEEIGYSRAWVYDVPVSYADTGATLGIAATRTSTMRLGVSVFTPHLRHLTTNAALIAYLATLASGRFDAGVGAGFTSAAYLARTPSTWAHIERYVIALRELLAGREVEWDGTVLSLMHQPACGIRFPIEVPMFVAAHGPKGYRAASRLGVGIITNPSHGDSPVPVTGECGLVLYGTVLGDGETPQSPRVLEAAAPGAGLALHLGERGPLAGTPEAKGYAASIAEVDESRRHLERFRGHLMAPSSRDRAFLTPEVIRRSTATGTPAELARELRRLEDAGAAAVFYQPAGPDITRELRAFFTAAQLRHETAD